MKETLVNELGDVVGVPSNKDGNKKKKKKKKPRAKGNSKEQVSTLLRRNQWFVIAVCVRMMVEIYLVFIKIGLPRLSDLL